MSDAVKKTTQNTPEFHFKVHYSLKSSQVSSSEIENDISSHHHHLSLNREGRWGTRDDFTTSFLHSSLFSTALWDLANSRPSIPRCCLPTSSSVCPVFFPLSLCLARWFWSNLMNGRHDHTTAVYVYVQWSGGLRVVRLPAGSWHGLPRCNTVFV